MPVVPMTSGSPSAQPSPQMPSETSLLMALADMHKQGRVPQRTEGEPVSKTPKMPKPKAVKGPL